MKTHFFFLFTLTFIICGFTGFSQKVEDEKYFQIAFSEQLQMLQGQKPVDFKRAVFLTENSFYCGKLNYQVYCSDISNIGLKLKNMIKQKGIERFRTAGNWATFVFMTDSSSVNNFKPYRYDFDDFMGDKDWSKMFVTKLMKTHGGNCHSLPYLYKILCEEIGANACLALAPNHVYIKHKDENNQWTNVEMTSGGFPRDQWIIKEMAITVESLKKEAYMAPLTPKEEIAMTMFDLAGSYQFKFGYDAFTLEVINTALKYFPNGIPLLQFKANCLQNLIKETRENSTTHISNAKLLKTTLASIDSLGYKDTPPEIYREWVKSVEEEKKKRHIN